MYDINDSTELGVGQPVYLKDSFYDTVQNPKWSWVTALNPLDDESTGALSAMPGALHQFTYPSQYSGKVWAFDFLHHDLSQTSLSGSDSSVNTPVLPASIVELKNLVASGEKTGTYAIDAAALSMGEWGATYHYTITVSNATNTDRTAVFRCRNFQSMTLGKKLEGEAEYTTQYWYEAGNGESDWWEAVSYTVPAGETITFEVVTTIGVSFGGTTCQFVVR